MRKASEHSPQELLIRFDSYFRRALDHPTWRAWREHAQKCYQYREGDQWTPAELKELENVRHQPPTVNNQVKVTLDRMVGQFVKQKSRLGYRGRNPQDEPGANALTDISRYIRQSNDLEFEERDMAEDGFTSGFGVLETYVTFDGLFQPEIKKRACDPFEVFPDPWSRRYDWNEDAQYICRAKWLSFDEARELYPDHEAELSSMSADTHFGGQLTGVEGFQNKNYVDYDEKGRPARVRVVECWWKEQVREALLLTTDDAGQPITIDAARLTKAERKRMNERPMREVERLRATLKVALFTGGILLSEPRESPHGNLYPFVPYFVHRRKNGEPYSLVWSALTLQDAINKRESKALHLLNSNQTLYESGAVMDKNALAEEIGKPDGQIEITRGFKDRFEIIRNVELAQSQFAMHQEAKADFRRVTGINPDAMGERSEMRSGIGVARKQQMTDVIIAPVFDNFRRTRAIDARVTLQFVRAYYTEPKILLITDDFETTRHVQLGADAIGAIKQGQYDVVVEDMPDTTTLQQEQLAMLGQILPQVIPMGPAWTEILLEMSDLRNKRELIGRVQQMAAPPPPEPKISVALQWDSLTPEEKIAWAGKFGMPALAKAQEMNPQPTTQQTKARTEIGRAQIHAQTEGGKQEIEIRKAGMQAMGDMQAMASQERMAAQKGMANDEA